MAHLQYCLMTADFECNEKRHAQAVMQELGITYQHATPQSVSDSWWFWNCENVPDALPPYLSPLNVDPMKAIGWGLSQEEAEAIATQAKEHP